MGRIGFVKDFRRLPFFLWKKKEKRKEINKSEAARPPLQKAGGLDGEGSFNFELEFKLPS